MNNPLQLVLMLIALFFMLFFLLKMWFKDKNSSQVAENSTPDPNIDETELSSLSQLVELEEEPHYDVINPPAPKISKNEILVINVIAKQNETFASYDLIQAISATGLQFGAMNIFHYYENNDERKKIMFSLASMTEPGEFDLDHMGEFTCKGLCLFMNLNEVQNIEKVFGLMLETAEQLADDLDGELFADPLTPFTDDILLNYQKKITEHVSHYAFT